MSPRLILAAHGDGRGHDRDSRLRELCAEIGDILRIETVPGLLSEPKALRSILQSHSPDRTVVLPLLFSDGYFYRARLAPLLASLGIAVWPPLIDWPRFAPFLIDAIASRAAASTGKPVILLVGHGSSRDERAAKAAQRLATRLSSRYRDVRPCFLEQPPFAVEAFGRIDASYAAVGLFLGAGLHGGEDFPALMSAAPAPPEFAFTVGRLKGLGELIAHEARDAIGRLAG